MFFNNTARFAASSLLAVCAAGIAHADEKHLTLDDIDGLARQNLVNSMRASDKGQTPAQGVSLNAPLSTPASPPPPVVATVVIPTAPKASTASAQRATPVTFVGAYSDMSGAHVMYDYKGGVYSAARGERLINGWVVTRVDGYHVSVSEGKSTWTDVISAPPTSLPTGDGAAVKAITDLSGPLPMATAIGTFGPNGR
jgi:hypothetical protein